MEVMKVKVTDQIFARIKVVVNNDGNMDLGTKGSLVMSLSQKIDKNTCYGEQITAGKLTEL